VQVWNNVVTEKGSLEEFTETGEEFLVGSSDWRWYTGFLIYLLILFVPPLIGFCYLNILDIKDSNEDPSSWWKCGVFCGFCWGFIWNCFSFVLIRKKVWVNREYKDFSPSWWVMVQCSFITGVAAMGMWVTLYFVEKRLVWMH